MQEDLARSGLSKSDAHRLKFQYLTPEQCEKLTDKKVPGYLIPYFGVDKKLKEMFRVRFLEQPKSGWGTKSKDQRYWQPNSTLPCFYFDPRVDWGAFGKDVTRPLHITEGEKKAAKACQSKIITIGLGGVWSWRSKKQGIPAIDDFDLITWEGRKVILTFDSDVVSNPMVMQALNALSGELLNRGAIVSIIRLPAEPGAKVGLDDYLAKHSAKKFNELKQTEYRTSGELWKLNDEVAYIEALNAVFKLDAGNMYRTREAFVNMAYADRNYTITDGDKMKTVNAADEWLKWPFRRTHNNLVYAPGHGRVLEGGDLNLWEGWGTEPRAGDISPWKSMMDYLFEDDERFYKWFLQWLSYPLQHPGAKLNSAVLLFSLTQGVGKSFIGYIMKDIYGGNFSVVGQEDIQSNFNGWCVNKQFILGEEIMGTDKRRDADKLKTMLTREALEVSIKYQPGYQIKDCANYLFTSNHPDAMFLETSDRRVAVYEVKKPPLPDSFYKKVDTWRKSGGAAHLFNHLLKVDLAGFNPAARAIDTLDKLNMTELSRSDLDSFAHSIKENPSNIFHMNGVEVKRELFTIDEVMNFYDPDGLRKTSHIAMSKALRRAGFRCHVVRTKQGTKKLWPLVNYIKWDGKGQGEMAGHYDGSIIPFDKDAQNKKIKGERS